MSKLVDPFVLLYYDRNMETIKWRAMHKERVEETCHKKIFMTSLLLAQVQQG